jgi:quaternary ammonium compound-resistance protein SugE
MAWLYLIIAGIFEIGFASLLKPSEVFTRLWPTLGVIILGCLSMLFLNLSINEGYGHTPIPLGTAYAVWTGIGALGAAFVGIVFFRDPVTTWRLVFLSTLLVSIVGLHYVSKH